jgi:hypothetical protein
MRVRMRKRGVVGERPGSVREVRNMVESLFSEQELGRFDRLSFVERFKVAVLMRSGIASELVDALPDVWAFEEQRKSSN